MKLNTCKYAVINKREKMDFTKINTFIVYQTYQNIEYFFVLFWFFGNFCNMPVFDMKINFI